MGWQRLQRLFQPARFNAVAVVLPSFLGTGGGRDQVHAHFGQGEITCASPHATVFLSRPSRKRYHLHGCPHVSYRTVGY